MTDQIDEIDEFDLHAYLDGQLEPRREAAVRAFIEANPATRERMRAYAEQMLLLRMSQAEGEADGREAAALPVMRHLLARWQRSRPRERALRAAVGLLLFGAGWIAAELSDRMPALVLPAYAQDALAVHEALGGADAKVIEAAGVRQEEVSRWLSARMGEPVKLPELHMIGLRLVGATLEDGDQGMSGMLVYEDRTGRRVTLAMVPEESAGPDQLELSEVHGYVVGCWRGKNFAYALVARTSETQVAQIAAAFGSSR
ncbi:anti-sigma factor family protein [Rhodospirillum centenum]|uniref:Anti-sigma factor n=1 Tax=Rhodospirillum centenum (strain ATCC 51521 / SW) TaxID=414684 RepID=B6IQH3_RHOCS|nr:anti-sigma factor [Rhodospirillum centenum]ACI97709.1 conserved hypothetical protein [Rhodospirillum centenum SW]